MSTDLFERVLAQAGRVVESKSSALVPLHWLTAILVACLIFSVIAKAPSWIVIGIFALLALAVLQSVISYNYFMTKNPDALRSERHALSKYAIDKGLYGDSDMGMLEVPKLGSEFILPGEIEAHPLSLPGKSARRRNK